MLSAGRSATPAATPDTAGVGAGRRRRRGSRKSAAAGGGIDPAIIDGEVTPPANGDGDAAGAAAAPRKARKSGAGPSALILSLKTEGFFSQRRSISDIRAGLGKKGHTLKSNEVSPTLVSLTQQGELQREKNGDNQWEYFV